jgi:hypothetical protein
MNQNPEASEAPMAERSEAVFISGTKPSQREV